MIATYKNHETNETKKKLAYSAHIDTKPTTPGALDNGTGVALLLTLAEELLQTPVEHPLEFVLFNGEDYYSMPGEMTFLEQSLNQPENYAFAMNIDGAGMQNSTISYSLYECPEPLTTQLDQFTADYPTVEKSNLGRWAIICSLRELVFPHSLSRLQTCIY